MVNNTIGWFIILGLELVGFGGQQKQLLDFVVLVATTLQPSGSTSSDGAHYWLRASKHYVAYLYSMVKVIWNSMHPNRNAHRRRESS